MSAGKGAEGGEGRGERCARAWLQARLATFFFPCTPALPLPILCTHQPLPTCTLPNLTPLTQCAPVPVSPCATHCHTPHTMRRVTIGGDDESEEQQLLTPYSATTATQALRYMQEYVAEPFSTKTYSAKTWVSGVRQPRGVWTAGLEQWDQGRRGLRHAGFETSLGS